MNQMAIRLALWLLKRPLTLSQRNLLTTAILERLGALPIRSSLSVNETTGEILVSGTPIDLDHARVLFEGAKQLLNNPVLKILWDQVAYNAIGFGVHKAENETQMYFARAALWWSQEEKRILGELSGTQIE